MVHFIKLPGQRFEGPDLVILSTVKFVLGEAEGTSSSFSYKGTQFAGFALYSTYSGVAKPSVRVITASEVRAGNDSEVKVEALKADGSLDSAFKGNVRVSLAAGSTDGIGSFRSGTQDGLLSLSLPMEVLLGR